MAIIDDIVLSFEEKVERVIHVAEGLKLSNVRLQQQVDELSAQLFVKNQEMEALESKFQSLKFAKNLAASPEEVRDAKLQVGRMIREIDKCMALLNR